MVIPHQHSPSSGSAPHPLHTSPLTPAFSALKEGRVIDADFYKKNILIMYPDWKFKGEESR